MCSSPRSVLVIEFLSHPHGQVFSIWEPKTSLSPGDSGPCQVIAASCFAFGSLIRSSLFIYRSPSRNGMVWFGPMSISGCRLEAGMCQPPRSLLERNFQEEGGKNRDVGWEGKRWADRWLRRAWSSGAIISYSCKAGLEERLQGVRHP